MASASPRFDIDHFFSCGRGRILTSALAQVNSLQPEVGRTRYVPLEGHHARGRTTHHGTTAPNTTLRGVLDESFEQNSDDKDRSTVNLKQPSLSDVSNRLMDNYK